MAPCYEPAFKRDPMPNAIWFIDVVDEFGRWRASQSAPIWGPVWLLLHNRVFRHAFLNHAGLRPTPDGPFDSDNTQPKKI
jgi:hypothetical protein